MYVVTSKRMLSALLVVGFFTSCTPLPWDFKGNVDLSGNHNTAHRDVLVEPSSLSPSSPAPPQRDTGEN